MNDSDEGNENELSETQVAKLNTAFDKLFDDYDRIFGDKNDNYQFVKYFGWLNKCNQVIEVISKTRKTNFHENIRLLSAYIALLPQCPFDSMSRYMAITLCERFHMVTRTYPIYLTLQNYWKQPLLSAKQLTLTDMNIIYFKVYYESKVAKEDLEVFLEELDQLFKNLHRILIKIIYQIGVANVSAQKQICSIIEKSIYTLVSRVKKNQTIDASNIHNITVGYQPIVYSTIQSSITDILLQCYYLKYGDREKLRDYLMELEPLMTLYSPIDRINATFNISLNILMNLSESDNFENYFVECTVMLCEMAIKNNTYSIIGYDQQLYKFIKKIVLDKMNDASKVVIIGEFIKRLKALDYINKVDPINLMFTVNDSVKRITPLLYQSYMSWKKYFLLFLCVCSQHFGPIGKQIFTKPFNNEKDFVVVDELVKWLGCGIYEIILYVTITLKYIVEHNPLLVVSTLEKCIEYYLAGIHLKNASGFLYGLAAMIAISSRNQYGIPHKIIRKVFDVIMILAENISQSNSQDNAIRMDCKRVIWLTISGICMLGSQIVKHFHADIFNYFSMTYDIRSFYGNVNVSELDYCDISYSLIALKNYAKYCPQLIDERISHKLNKYFRNTLEVLRIRYYTIINSVAAQQNSNSAPDYNYHFSNKDLIFSVFFELLLELRDVALGFGVDIYTNTAKICFNLITHNNILCSLIFDHCASLKEIYDFPIYHWHKKITENPFIPCQYFYGNYNVNSEDTDDQFLSSLPMIIEPLEAVEKRMNHYLPISITIINNAVEFIGKILCRLPDEDVSMFIGIICEHVNIDISLYVSPKHYYNTQSNWLLIFIIYLKECLKTKKILKDNDTLCMIYNSICHWKQIKSPIIQCLLGEVTGLYFAITRNIDLAAKTLVTDYRVAVSMENEILVGGALLSICNIHYNCKHAEIDNTYLDINIKLMLSYSKSSSVSCWVQHWSRYALYWLLPHVKSAPPSLIFQCLSTISQALMNTSSSYPHSVYDLSRCLASVIECELGLVDNVMVYELEMIEMCIYMLGTYQVECIQSQYFHVMSLFLLYCNSMKKHNLKSCIKPSSSCLAEKTNEKSDKSGNIQENLNSNGYLYNLISLPIENLKFSIPYTSQFKPKNIMISCVEYLIKSHHVVNLNHATNLLKQLIQLYPDEVYLTRACIDTVLACNEHPMYVICEGIEGFLFGMLDVTNECESANKCIRNTIKSLIYHTFKSADIPLCPWFVILQKVISPSATNTTMHVHRPFSNVVILQNKCLDENKTYQCKIVMPYWSTRKYALSLLRDIFVWCSAEHFELTSQSYSSQRKSEIFEQVSEIMKISLIATLSNNNDIELEGLMIIYEIIKTFGNVKDPQFTDQLFLEQYILQINGSLKLAFKLKADPNSTLYACKIISQWINIKLENRQVDGCDDMYALVGNALEQFQKDGSTLTHPIQGETAYTTRILGVIECFAHIYNSNVNPIQTNSLSTPLDGVTTHRDFLEKNSKFIGICCLTIIIDWCKIPTNTDAEDADSLASTFFFKHIISGNFTNFVVHHLVNTLLMSVLWLKNNFDNVPSLINGECSFDLSNSLSENDIWNYLFSMIYFVLMDICYNTENINNRSLLIVMSALDQLLDIVLVEYQLENNDKSDLMLELLDVLYRVVLGTSNGDLYPSIISTISTIIKVVAMDKENGIIMGKVIHKVSTIMVHMIHHVVLQEIFPAPLIKQINYQFLPCVSFSDDTGILWVSVCLLKLITKCCSELCNQSYVIPLYINSYLILYIPIFETLATNILNVIDQNVDLPQYDAILSESNALFTMSLYNFDKKLCQHFLKKLQAAVQSSRLGETTNLKWLKIKFLLSSYEMIVFDKTDSPLLINAVHVCDYVLKLIQHTDYYDEILFRLKNYFRNQKKNQIISYVLFGVIEDEMKQINAIFDVEDHTDPIFIGGLKTILGLLEVLLEIVESEEDRNATVNSMLRFAVPLLLHFLDCTDLPDADKNECLAIVQGIGNDFPVSFKEYMNTNVDEKLCLQQHLIENAKHLKGQSKNSMKCDNLSGKPSKKLSMDFSHFE